MAVNNSAGKSKLKYDNIQDLILSEEVCRRDAGIRNAQDQALVMENRGRNRSRGLDDRAKSNDRSHSKGRSQFKEMRECFQGKMVTYKETVGIGIKNKLKRKMKRMMMRKILQ